MPLLADRVKESTTTQGTGTLTLAGAPPGFRTFTGAFGNGASVYYVIAGPTEWEIGFGTTGAGTLTRDTVLVSSAGGTTKVNLSAGPKDVFCSYVADRAVTTSDAATLTNKTIDDYTNNVGANSTHFRIKAGATLARGDVIKASGFTPGEQAIEVVKTASATDVAIGIVEQALSTGQFGTAVVIGELFNVNTNGLSVGATLYQNGAGGYTTTKPNSGFYQALGWVVRANTSNGVIAVNVVTPLYVETSTNTANTSVLRDGSGNFAAGTITAALSGNASTATALQTARTINGVSFNGTADITVTAAAGTLSGNTLASGVTASSLTSVGTLTSLAVSGNLAVDTNTFFVDAVNNRVGVNCTPVVPAQIRTQTNGNVGFQPATVLSGGNKINNFNDAAAVAVGLELDAAAHVMLIAGAEAVRVDAARNLGLGVTPSPWISGASSLDIRSTSAFADVGGSTTIANNSYRNSGGGWVYKTANFASRLETDSGAFRWFNATSGANAGDPITFAQPMTLDASGNLGVGTASPSHRLQAVVAAGADRQIFQAAVSGTSNGFRVQWNHANLKTYVSITDIPTSSAGLPAGTLYSDGGTIKIA